MNFYERWILPPIFDLVVRQNQLKEYRREVVAAASGRVLEVGVGSGLNFPLYGKQVETAVGSTLRPARCRPPSRFGYRCLTSLATLTPEGLPLRDSVRTVR